jgi:probable F420-dependent oxidoreductase
VAAVVVVQVDTRAGNFSNATAIALWTSFNRGRWDDRRMQVGLHALGIGAGARRDVIDAVACAAEVHGFATLWSGEHVVMVDESSSRYPYAEDGRIAVPPSTDWNDPMVGLSFAAAATTTIGIATGVLLLPEHNPVVVAKQAATLDVLCAGRLTLGVGVGWSRDEFDALGVPFARRAARTAEYAAAMRALWSEDVASFHGEFVRFEAIRSNPKPFRGGRIPIVLGGNSDAALKPGGVLGRRLVRLQPGRRNRGRRPPGAPRGEVPRGRARPIPSAPCRGPGPSAGRRHRGPGRPGVDEMVIVESPPADPQLVPGWASGLADRWIPTAR